MTIETWSAITSTWDTETRTWSTLINYIAEIEDSFLFTLTFADVVQVKTWTPQTAVNATWTPQEEL